MNAVISSVFHKLASFFHKAGFLFHNTSSLFHKIGSPFRKIGSLLRKVGSPFHKVGPLSNKVGPLSSKIGFLFHKIGPLFLRIGSLFRKIGSLLERFIRKLWLAPPFRSIDRALQRTRKGPKPLEYRFLPYVTSVLRVLGWAVLIIGVLASILIGLDIMNGGLMVWETELRGVGMGVSTIVLGIIGSFLAWLFLLVSRELICLFIHVKENTRNTAESITE
jgi:uncharacterized membrane protein